MTSTLGLIGFNPTADDNRERPQYGRRMNRHHALIVVSAVVLGGLFWVDPLFIPLALLGPIVTGAIAGPRGASRSAATAWLGAGLVALVSDWIINNEDQLFHLGLALWTAGVTLAVGAAAAYVHGRTLRRRALRNGISRVHRQAARP